MSKLWNVQNVDTTDLSAAIVGLLYDQMGEQNKQAKNKHLNKQTFKKERRGKKGEKKEEINFRVWSWPVTPI